MPFQSRSAKRTRARRVTMRKRLSNPSYASAMSLAPRLASRESERATFSGDTTALRMRLAVPLRNRDRKSPLNIGASRGRREPRSRIDYERGIRHHARERAPRKNRVGGGDPIIQPGGGGDPIITERGGRRGPDHHRDQIITVPGVGVEPTRPNGDRGF